MAGYCTITNADAGKVLAFPLAQLNGNANNFAGATAALKLRDQNGSLYTRTLAWNAATVQWEYAVVAGEFAVGRYWAMVAVTFAGPVGPVYSSEVIFDVIAAD